MKFYMKCMAGFLVLFVLVVPMFLKGADGKPVMSISDWLPGSDRLVGWAREIRQDVLRTVSGEEQIAEEEVSVQTPAQPTGTDIRTAPKSFAPESGKMYKWRDEQGRWHFSSDKPADLRAVSIEQLPEMKNVMDTPVEAESDESMMKLPGLGGGGKSLGGDILDGIQRMTEERDQ